MLTSENITNTIVSQLNCLGVRRIWLFGSASRLGYEKARDIDLLVELKNINEREPIGLRWFQTEITLAHAIGKPVDLVSYNASDESFLKLIETDMKLIYDQG